MQTDKNSQKCNENTDQGPTKRRMTPSPGSVLIQKIKQNNARHNKQVLKETNTNSSDSVKALHEEIRNLKRQLQQEHRQYQQQTDELIKTYEHNHQKVIENEIQTRKELISQNMEQVSHLQNQLDHAFQVFKEQHLDNQILEYENTISSLKKQQIESFQLYQENYEKQKIKHQMELDTKLRELNQKLNLIESQFSQEKLNHQRTKDSINAKREQFQSDLDTKTNLLQEYEKKLASKETEIKELTQIFGQSEKSFHNQLKIAQNQIQTLNSEIPKLRASLEKDKHETIEKIHSDQQIALQQLQNTFNSLQELNEQQISKLQSDLYCLQDLVKYQPPRQEDVEKIQSLQVELRAKRQDIIKLEDQISFFRNELGKENSKGISCNITPITPICIMTRQQSNSQNKSSNGQQLMRNFRQYKQP